MYKVLDLFAGAGGMSLGFEQTGNFQVAVAVEKHPHAQLTYERNHSNTIVLQDILEITDYDEFRRKYGEFEVIVGGPPCQGFSNANRQKNTIISQNNSLVKKYVEVIENLKPMAFVMENVKMLTSDTHRFYLSKKDKIDKINLTLRSETLCLYNGKFPIADIGNYLFDTNKLCHLLMNDKDINAVKLFYKKLQNNKYEEANEKELTKINKLIGSFKCRNRNIPNNYVVFEENTLENIINFLENKLSFDDAKNYFSSFIEVQKVLKSAKELQDNEIIIDEVIVNDEGVFINVRSFTVIEYIKKKLGELYLIDDGILNAAWFGAPQLRERYIALGILKDVCENKKIKPKLPTNKIKIEEYRTVWDALADLENVKPGFNSNDEPIILNDYKVTETALSHELRNSNKLYNHVITKSRETALQRFAALKPGQNFHSLSKELIQNTYSKPERTQNSIYLRLDYNKPSGTVTNVRKSMWVHPCIDRAISIREAARLQTFPDNFEFKGTKDSQYQQVGNAVPPIMAKAIANKLYKLLNQQTGKVYLNKQKKEFQMTNH